MRDPSWAKTDDSGYDVDAFDATQINTAADVTVLGIDAGTTGQPSLKSYIERLDSGKKMNPCFGEQAPSKYDDPWRTRQKRASDSKGARDGAEGDIRRGGSGRGSGSSKRL